MSNKDKINQTVQRVRFLVEGQNEDVVNLFYDVSEKLFHSVNVHTTQTSTPYFDCFPPALLKTIYLVVIR